MFIMKRLNINFPKLIISSVFYLGSFMIPYIFTDFSFSAFNFRMHSISTCILFPHLTYFRMHPIFVCILFPHVSYFWMHPISECILFLNASYFRMHPISTCILTVTLFIYYYTSVHFHFVILFYLCHLPICNMRSHT